MEGTACASSAMIRSVLCANVARRELGWRSQGTENRPRDRSMFRAFARSAPSVRRVTRGHRASGSVAHEVLMLCGGT